MVWRWPAKPLPVRVRGFESHPQRIYIILVPNYNMALAFDPSIQQQEEIEGSQEASLGTAVSIIENIKTDVKVDVKVEQIYSDDALREILGTEYEKFLELIKHLPPELQKDALYSIKAYLEGQKHTLESLKNYLSYSVYSTTVDEITQTKETLIGTITKKRQPGEDQYFYRGKEIDDQGFLVATFGNAKVTLPLEDDLGKQNKELREQDGYEHVYWIHKDGDKVKIEELGETGDTYRGNYVQTYQYVQDNNGTHVLSFQYRPDNEGNILTYYQIDNNGWKVLEDPKELQGLRDELGRDMSEVVKEKEPGFFVPENEFFSMYLYTPTGREQLLGGSEPAPPTFNEKLELVKQEISQYMEQYETKIETLEETPPKELSSGEFSLIISEAYQLAISPKEIYRNPYVLPMDEETAIHSLEKLGLNGEQIKETIDLSHGNPYTLARMVDKIKELIKVPENKNIEEEQPLEQGPLLGTKEAFQFYLEYKQLLGGGEEMPKNEITEQSSNEILPQELENVIKTDEATANVPNEVPEEIKKEAQYYAEAIAVMDWTLDKEDFANFVAQKLLNKQNA